MTRRNPPSVGLAAAHRNQRRARAAAARDPFARPDATMLRAWRTALVARRGYGPGVHPDYLAVARRQGGWCGGVDWRSASDAAVAAQWRRHAEAGTERAMASPAAGGEGARACGT